MRLGIYGTRIGFTGTSEGMTNDQLLQVHMLLGDLKSAGATQATHGMCVGADKQFHDMAKALRYFVVGLPGTLRDGRVWKRAECDCDLVLPERFFLSRNEEIVQESDLMIATPQQVEEQFKGSGTWHTIRYARAKCVRHARKVRNPLLIIWPDGSGVVENVPGIETLAQYREELEHERSRGRTAGGRTPRDSSGGAYVHFSRW